MFKRTLIAAALAFISVFIISCDDTDPVSDQNVNVSVYGRMTDSDVTKTFGKVNGQAGPDSIHISSIKILVSRLAFHPSGTDDNTESVIHTAPAIFVATDSEDPHFIASGDIPEGNFNAIKFEIHRFTPSEVNQYQNNDLFDDFTTNERNTVIIEGTSYLNGQGTNFVHRADLTANLFINITENNSLFNKDSAQVIIEADPNLIFFSQGELIDPTLGTNLNKINNSIKNALKARIVYFD